MIFLFCDQRRGTPCICLQYAKDLPFTIPKLLLVIAVLKFKSYVVKTIVLKMEDYVLFPIQTSFHIVYNPDSATTYTKHVRPKFSLLRDKSSHYSYRRFYNDNQHSFDYWIIKENNIITKKVSEFIYKLNHLYYRILKQLNY